MRQFFAWVLAALVLFALITTIVPMSEAQAWWIRAVGFPRVQILILALVALTFLILSYGRSRLAQVAMALMLLVIVYQAVQIFPFTSIAPEEVRLAASRDPRRRISVVVSNVLMKNRESAPVINQIRQASPDVILAVETDNWWVGALNVLQRAYPHVVAMPLDNTYGMLLMSRLPLVRSDVRFLVEDSIPSIKATVALRSGEEVDIYCLHPRPPIPGSDSEQRDAELVRVGLEIRRAQRPALVIGDLNDVAWSQTTRLFQKVSGMLDPRRGRGTYSTFHAKYFFVRYPLDHIFHTNDFQLNELRVLDDVGSDHFPMFGSFTFQPELREVQPAPRPDGEDMRDAQENLDPGR